MKLTKEDYMRLPKERLAELLVEVDNEVAAPRLNSWPCITDAPWWNNSPYAGEPVNTSISTTESEREYIYT